MLHLTPAKTWSKELCLINTEPINFDPSLMTVFPSPELNYFETAQNYSESLVRNHKKMFSNNLVITELHTVKR
jgi:hypothetical protein